MATDGHGRRIDYLRISLTDRCNLRCEYCMPREGIRWLPHEEMLAYEEIERFATVAVGEGVSKIRLTGGEPLVRKGVVDHVRRLLAATGLESLALTTNGLLLAEHVGALADAGLTRVNVSLDTLDAAQYERITGGGELSRVLAGIDAALAAGLAPVKVNVVVVRAYEQDLAPFVRMTLDRPIHVRFIEYMPTGGDDGDGSSARPRRWSSEDVVPSAEVLERLTAIGCESGLGEIEPVERAKAPGGWGPARYFRFAGAAGTLGVISPLSGHFCAECNRLRLTADGRVRTCLFSDEELDARAVLRGGTDEDVRDLIRDALAAKPERHDMDTGTGRRMSQIGG